MQRISNCKLLPRILVQPLIDAPIGKLEMLPGRSETDGTLLKSKTLFDRVTNVFNVLHGDPDFSIRKRYQIVVTVQADGPTQYLAIAQDDHLGRGRRLRCAAERSVGRLQHK